MIRNFIFLLLAVVFSNMTSASDLDSLYEQKVSVVELFLCKLESKIGCRTGSGGNAVACSNKLYYDSKNKTIVINLNINNKKIPLSEFEPLSQNEKYKVLTSIMSSLAMHVGLIPLDGKETGMRYGEIQKIKFDSPSIDTTHLKHVVSQSTVLEYFVAYNEYVYWVYRSLDGSVNIQKFEKEDFGSHENKKDITTVR